MMRDPWNMVMGTDRIPRLRSDDRGRGLPILEAISP